MDFYGFYTGKILDAYEYLGCHVDEKGAVFRTFAPAADKISVIGSFNDWTETPMEKIYDGNFWEVRIENAVPGMLYKYRIYRPNGFFVDHCDPYGYSMEMPPASASIIRSLDTYRWKDAKWLKIRTDHKNQPLNIYEVHLGSWKKKKDDTRYSYKQIAKPLISYVKEKGYNYIEIMPLAEHPVDNSWGYQQTGFYSPTARYGTPDELRYLIDYAHKNEIGVILDFVPVHFAVDGYALTDYDGTALYEYPHVDVGVSEWGSKNFNHSRGEVQSFLQSNARYWIKEFHFDGLRIDALSNIIYWHGDQARGVNVNAVDFIRHMNRSLKAMDPSIMLIAEDSTSFDGVTKPADLGGLSFDYKWDMGWMNDTLDYFKKAPWERPANYHKLTFSMMYFWGENYLLPLSHDEVVHGKATIMQKMYGDYEMKFPQARALYLYMYTHPGKKLNFMANEIGQLREWDEMREQDWDLVKYPIHDAFAQYMKDLSEVYLQHPALSELDYDQGGFRWVDCHQEEKCIYVFERTCSSERMLVLLNLSGEEQTYELNTSGLTSMKLILSTDDEKYGGKGAAASGDEKKVKEKTEITIPPFAGLLYRIS